MNIPSHDGMLDPQKRMPPPAFHRLRSRGVVQTSGACLSLWGAIQPPTPMIKSTSRILTVGLLLVGAGICQTASGAIKAGDRLLIDFGPSTVPSDGSPMVSPDSNGLYWNNAIMNQRNAKGNRPPDVVNMVTTANVATGVNITFTNNWQMNGNDAGGLLDPNPSFLGDLAQVNATRDYIFLNTSDSGSSASMTFSGLNPLLTYDFQIFATRRETNVRTTRYSITDVNGLHTYDLQTSGPGIGAGGYNGNNDELAYLTGIVPNEFGEITLTLSSPTNNFAYIGAMSLTAVPEPHEMGLAIAMGCLVLVAVRRYQLRRAQV